MRWKTILEEKATLRYFSNNYYFHNRMSEKSQYFFVGKNILGNTYRNFIFYSSRSKLLFNCFYDIPGHSVYDKYELVLNKALRGNNIIIVHFLKKKD